MLRLTRSVFGVAWWLSGLGLMTIPGIAQPSGAPVPETAKKNLARLPLAFEKRTDVAADRFVARGEGYLIGLEAGKATIQAGGKDAHAVSIGFKGAAANPASVPGGELSGKVNNIRGNDPAKWEIGNATFGRVTYPDVYPGIDVVYYGNQQQLEFDMVVRPGADPSAIRMKVEGAEKLSLDDSGALKIDDYQLLMPRIYQEVGGAKKTVGGHFRIVGQDEVALKLDRWDRSRSLVIDPTIVYSATFGGGLSSSAADAIGLDSSGNIVIAGYTYAADFPTLNAYQNYLKSTATGNAFVTKINAAGTALVYSTYLGGSSFDEALALSVDTTGAAWVLGYTSSTDFPLLNAAQTSAGNGFLARLNASGVLQFSTYLSGSVAFHSQEVATDSLNNGYVTGNAGASFSTTPGVVQPTTGTAFVTKYSPSGAVMYSTRLGGASTSGAAIAVDSSFNAYVTGFIFDNGFTGMPSGGAHTTNAGGGDAFVAKINANGTAYVYFTYLGGSAFDQGYAIAVDGLGDAYIAGQTQSAGIATPGAAIGTLPSQTNGFVAELNPTGTSFTYVTYLGGNRVDTINGLTVDGSGNVYVAGSTDSTTFPSLGAVQPGFPGNPTSVYSSTNSGSSFSAYDTALPGSVSDISINPSGASAVAATEVGLYRSTNGGTSWTQQSTGVATSISRSPVSSSTIYAGQFDTVYTSVDDGVTWTSSFFSPGTSVCCSAMVVADGASASTVYVYSIFTGGGFFVSTDGGSTFTQITSLPLGANGYITSVAATTDGALYVSANTGSPSFTSNIYRSTNQGGSFSVYASNIGGTLASSGTTLYAAAGTLYVNNGPGGSLAPVPGGFFGAQQIAVSQQNPSILYAVTFSNTIQETTDGGTTFNQVGTLPANVISYYNSHPVVDPSNSAHLLLVTQVLNAGFAAKLNSTGSALIWSTYLGSLGYTSASGVATDGHGNAFIAGSTSGNTFLNATTPTYGFPVTSVALPSGYFASAFLTEISDSTAACSLTVLPGSITTSSLPTFVGTPLTFSVVAPSGCQWTASTTQTFATITSGASGTGSGVISVQLAQNSGATRSANLNVSLIGQPAQSIPITQAGATCTYTLDQPSGYSVSAAGGSISPVLTTQSGCPYVVTNNYRSAITITANGSGSASATIGLGVTPNRTVRALTYSLPVGSTTITINQTAAGFAFTGGSLPTATAGQAYSATVSATGGTPPYTYGGSGFPSGLGINASTGVISGTTTQTGSFTISISVRDSASPANSTTAGFTLTVNPAPPPVTAVIPPPEEGEILFYSPSTTGTALLFPHVQNQSGVDTEITLANTSSNPLGTPSASGSCTLSFYGSGAPTPATNVTGPTVAPGAVSTFLLSSYAPGFQGYMIANCGFPLARGSARVTLPGLFVEPENAQIITLPRSVSSPQNFLIPFVTNQAGFDSAIIIANTTSDPFGTTPGAGACTLNFYGIGAPASPYTTPSIASGTSITRLLSGIAPGFQGYIIGSCAFGAVSTFNFALIPGRGPTLVSPSESVTLPRGTAVQPLLFPAVTNQNGADTAIAIANTTADPFGAQGLAPQPGTCSLMFYGSGAPATNPLTTPTISPGTVYTFTLSSVAPGFSGYIFPQCNFPGVKGFSFQLPPGTFTIPSSTYNAFSIVPEQVALPRDNTDRTTTLLFNHVNSTNGNDTNITISNTSVDPFGGSGVTPQAGTCTVNYYGTGAPSSQTSASIAAGGQLIFSLATGGGGLAGAPNFNGYMIATCGFPVARGVAAFAVPPTLTLSGGTLPSGSTSQPYSTIVTAAGGVAPYTYGATGLPVGIGINANNGVISGSTTQTGIFTVTVTVHDTQSHVVSAVFTLLISAPAPPPPLMLSGSLPQATAQEPYSASFSGSGGVPPYHYSASGLPSGILIDMNTGAIGGHTTLTGSFAVNISVTDSTGVTASSSIMLTVVPPPPVSLSGGNLGSIVVGTPVSTVISAGGGAPPYTYTIAAGSPPPGLSLNSGGTLRGTPITAGSYSFTVKATDSTGGTASGAFSITITPPPLTINAPSPLATGVVTIGYPTQTISAKGGKAPYMFALTGGSLPAGLTLSSTGMISGTPTAATSGASFMVTATDSSDTPSTGTANLSITVQPFTQNIVLSAGSLSFSLATGAPDVPPSQNIGVQSTMVTQPVNYLVAVQPASATWLSAAGGGATPGSVPVSLTQAALSLAAGTYTANVVVTCTSSGCAGNSQPVPVTLTVSSPPPVLSVQLTVLSFNTTSASPQATTESLVVSNTGGGAIGFASVSCGAPWCAVSGVPGTLGAGAKASLTITADPTGLASGYYYTSISIVTSAGSASVPVTFNIAANGLMSLSPAGAQFTLPQGGSLTGGSFLVDITGPTPASYSATVAPGAPYLQIVNGSGMASGTAPGTVTYGFDNAQISQLAPGAYYGSIQVTSDGASNSPQSYEVVVNVTAPTTPVVPNPTPGGLVFLTKANVTPPAQTITVYSFTNASTAFQASASTTSGGSWLSVSPKTGSTSFSSPGTVTASVDPTGLKPGVYKGAVNFAFSATAVRSVNVTLVVENTASATTSAISPKDTTNVCTPSQLVPTSTGLVSNFAAPAAWPVPLGITLVDDCGNLINNGQIVATFSNGDPPLILTLGDPTAASYIATWTPQHAAGQITINAQATAPKFTTATAQIAGAVTPNNAPILADLAIANFYNPIGGAPLAPGALVQITGQYLSAQTMNAPSIPLPLTLGGTSVIIGGVQAPVSMVSPGQVNAQVPFELPAGQPYQVIVNANSALTTPQSFQAGAASPGLGVQPNGFVQAGHALTGAPVTKGAPAAPGEIISVYLVGMGATTVPVASGNPGPSGTFATTVINPMLTLNGENTTVSFSGLIPGLVGVYQVNFQVPSDEPNGDLTLTLVQSAFTSNSGLLPVHN